MTDHGRRIEQLESEIAHLRYELAIALALFAHQSGIAYPSLPCAECGLRAVVEGHDVCEQCGHALHRDGGPLDLPPEARMTAHESNDCWDGCVCGQRKRDKT